MPSAIVYIVLLRSRLILVMYTGADRGWKSFVLNIKLSKMELEQGHVK